MGADLVEEVPVMGNDDYCIIETGEKVFKPVYGLEIELIGWFI
jgi:hypothetical protein